MYRPTVLTIITVHADESASLLTYDIESLPDDTVAEVRRLLGPPKLEELLSAADVAAHMAGPRSVVFFADPTEQ